MTKVRSVRLSEKQLEQFTAKVRSLCGIDKSTDLSLLQSIIALIEKPMSTPTIIEYIDEVEHSEPENTMPRCMYSAPFKEKGEIWIWCDNPTFRRSRKTNKIPLLACLRCEQRLIAEENDTEMKRREKAPRLEAPKRFKVEDSFSIGNEHQLQFILRRIDVFIIAGRVDLLTKNENEIWDAHKTRLRRK